MSKIFPKWTSDELQYLKDNYGKISLPIMAEYLGRTYNTTNNRCIRLGLTKNKVKKQWMITKGKRRYTRDENYFDINLNKGDNLYWAGFIATDGCIDDYNSNNREKSLKFKLQNKDKEQVIKFMKALHYNAPIKQNRKDKGWQFSLSSNKICADLKKYFNIVPRKTWNLKPPNLSDKQDILKFLVGCFDGDGCIYKSNNKISFHFISASYDFILWIKNEFSNLINKNNIVLREKIPQSDKHCICWEFAINGKLAEEAYRVLMSVNCPRLERKWGPWRHLLK